jgi:hypothetical protein
MKARREATAPKRLLLARYNTADAVCGRLGRAHTAAQPLPSRLRVDRHQQRTGLDGDRLDHPAATPLGCAAAGNRLAPFARASGSAPWASMQRSSGPVPRFRLHAPAAPAVTAPVVHILRRVGDLAPLGARSQRQHNEERGEPSVPVHRRLLPPDPPCLTRASDRLNQARVIVLDVADPRAHRPAGHLF